MSAKKLPGIARFFLVYDNRIRLVLLQDVIMHDITCLLHYYSALFINIRAIKVQFIIFAYIVNDHGEII